MFSFWRKRDKTATQESHRLSTKDCALLQSQYPDLSNFLSTVSPELWSSATPPYQNDEEIIRDCVQMYDFGNAVKEAQDLLGLEIIPWQEMAVVGYRYFRNETEARKWLTQAIAIVEDELSREQG